MDLKIEALRVLEKGSAPKAKTIKHKLPFSKGDILEGRVIKVKGDTVTLELGKFQIQAQWKATLPAKIGMLLRLKVSSIHPKIHMKVLDEAAPMARSLESWAPLVSELRDEMPDIPFVKVNQEPEAVLEDLKNFVSKNGLSTESLMSRWMEGRLSTNELIRDMKIQLLTALKTGTLPESGPKREAVEALLETIRGHQILNLSSINKGFILFPILILHERRVEEWVFQMKRRGEKGAIYSITLSASPPHIGPMKVRMTYLSSTKELALHFLVEREEAKRLIESHIPLLKKGFEKTPINLAGVRVELSRAAGEPGLPADTTEGKIISTKV